MWSVDPFQPDSLCIFLSAPEKLPALPTVAVAPGDVWSDADWETTTLKVLKEGSRRRAAAIEFQSPIAPPPPRFSFRDVTLTRVQFFTPSNDPRAAFLLG